MDKSIIEDNFNGENPYKILQLESGASSAAIRRQFRRLALATHPDKNIGNESAAKERFFRLKKAYEFLQNAELKAKYDEFWKQWQKTKIHLDAQDEIKIAFKRKLQKQEEQMKINKYCNKDEKEENMYDWYNYNYYKQEAGPEESSLNNEKLRLMKEKNEKLLQERIQVIQQRKNEFLSLGKCSRNSSGISCNKYMNLIYKQVAVLYYPLFNKELSTSHDYNYLNGAMEVDISHSNSVIGNDSICMSDNHAESDSMDSSTIRITQPSIGKYMPSFSSFFATVELEERFISQLFVMYDGVINIRKQADIQRGTATKIPSSFSSSIGAAQVVYIATFGTREEALKCVYDFSKNKVHKKLYIPLRLKLLSKIIDGASLINDCTDMPSNNDHINSEKSKNISNINNIDVTCDNNDYCSRVQNLIPSNFEEKVISQLRNAAQANLSNKDENNHSKFEHHLWLEKKI